MLSRFDLERPIENEQDFDRILLSCLQAKNSLTRQHGFAPEQIVLGKAMGLPGSLVSDLVLRPIPWHLETNQRVKFFDVVWRLAPLPEKPF